MKKQLIFLVILACSLIFVFATILNKINNSRTYTVDVSRAAVVKQLQALSRYETSSYTIEKIIEAGSNEGNALSQFLYGDRILLIAHGETVAGFDLATLSEDNIQLRDKLITINLPPAQIFFTRLDSEKTTVYDRNQGILGRGDKDLESTARAAAEQSITQAACEGGILVEASNNARNQLTAILKTIGFETVVINIPDSKC